MKKSLRLLTLIFFSLAMPLFAETYYWAGGGADANWTTVDNWRTGSEAGTVATAYPTTGDTAYIAGDYTVTVDTDITLAELNIKKSGNTFFLTDDWKTILTGSGKLTFGAMDFNRASSTNGVIGTLELFCNATCSGEIQTHSGTALIINPGSTLSANTLTHSASDKTPKSQITVKGNLAVTEDIKLQANGNDGCNSLYVDGGTVTAKNLTWDTNKTYENAGLKAISNSGTITLSGALTATGPVTNTGAITSTTGDITFSSAVDGASGTITSTSGNITTSATDASALGTVSTSGVLKNSGTGAVTVKEFSMGADTSVTNSSTGSVTVTKLTGNKTATLSAAAGSVTVSGYDESAVPSVTVATDNVSLGTGTITALTVNASAEATVTGALTVSGALQNNGTLIAAANITVTGATTNSGTISAGEKTITFNGAVTGGTLTATSGTITAKAGASIASLTLGSSSKANVTGNLTVSGATSNAGAITASGDIANNGTLTSTGTITMTGATATLDGSGSSTIADFTYEPTATSGTGLKVASANEFTNFSCATNGAKITLDGANTIGTLSVTSGGGTLTVNAAQTISGDLSLEGTGAGANLLTVTGSGNLDISASQSKKGNHLSVDWDNVSIGGTGYYIANSSKATSDPNYGARNNWIILNSAMQFVWTGDTSEDWGTASNWNLNLIPGTGLEYEGVSTKTYSVTIPNSPSSGRYPEASAGYTINSLNIGTSAGSSAKLTLHSGSTYHNITIKGTLPAALVNYGTIIYSGSDRITKGDETTFINDTAHGGTVVFNSAAGATDLAAVEYYNLTINGSGTDAFEANGDLTVSNDLKILAGTAKFNNSDADDTTSVNAAAFSAGTKISLGNAEGDAFTVTGALSLPSDLDSLTLAGTITAGGTGISLGHDATLAANTTFASATKTDAAVKLTGVFTVENTAALTTSSAKALTLENTNLVNTGAVTDGYIIFEGAAAQTFTPNEGSTYERVTIDKTSGSINVNEKELTVKSLAIDNSAITNFNTKATVTNSFSNTATTGSIAFKAGCDFTPAATFNTEGELTLDGSTTACAFTNGLTHNTTGPTNLYGTLNTTNAAITLGATTIAAVTTITTTGGAATFGATTLNANLTINTGAGAATFGTINGARALTSNGTDSLTFAGAVGATAAPTTITVTGPTIVTATSIKTTGLQEYKNNLTFNADCAVTGPVKMTGDSVTLSGTGKATIADFTYEPTATSGTGLTVASANEFTKFSCATDDAKITLSGANTIVTFESTGANSNITLSGANTFGTTSVSGTLSITHGKTLTVTAAQTVNGTLVLQGTDSQQLTVTSTTSGSLTITGNQHTGQYLTVARDKVSITGGYYSATDSVFDSEPLYGHHKNWILLNKEMVFEWTSDASSVNWETPKNWNYELVPGLASATGGVDTRGYPVKIATKPKLPATGAISYSVGQLTINDADSNLTLSAASVSVVKIDGVSNTADGTLTNKGTIYYSGAGRITNGTAYINDASNGGTVNFNGTVNASDLSDAVDTRGVLPNGTYHNLTISGSGTYTAAAALTVNNDLKQSAGALTTNGDTKVLNDLTISGGAFTSNANLEVTNALEVNSTASANFNASATTTVTSAKTVKFNTSGTVSLGNTTNDSFEVKEAALELPATSETLGGLVFGGKIKAGGTGVKLSMNATLAADTTFESALTIGAAATLTAPAAMPPAAPFNVTTNGALKTSDGALTLTNASLTNTATVTNGNIIFTESAASAQTFTPFSSTYDNVKVNKTNYGSWTLAAAMTATNCQISSNGTIAINAALSASSCQITNNGTMTFAAAAPFSAGSLTLSNNDELSFNAGATVSSAFTDTSASGNIYFNAGCSFTPQAIFSTSGTLTLDGSTTACAFDGGLKHTAGLTILYGALNTSNKNIELETTTLAADTTINAGTGTPPGTAKFGALDGAYTLTSSGTGLVTFGGAVGGTTQPTSITITGPAAINAATNVNGPITVNGKTTVSAPSISTTGLQLYKDDISFSAACSVTGTVQAAAGIKTSAAVTATFINDVWLYTSAAATLGGTGGSLAITGNLYFVGESKAASVASNVTAKNVLLLHGTVDIAAGATLASSSGDVILLGAAYDIKDNKDGAAASGVENLFAYNHNSRKKNASYRYSTIDEFPTECPDTPPTPISQTWSGAVTTNAGAKISAGQNFYANGLASLGSGAWTLLLKDNDKQTEAFAEAYNSTITNCTASPIGGSGSVYLAAAENNTVSGCSDNVIKSRPVIAEAWTVYDDVVYVSFKDTITGNPVAIENSCNEISAAAAQISYYGGSFVSTWTDADCQQSTNASGVGDISSFYIKAGSTWNTDAFEISAGAAQSTDRGRGSPYAKPEHRTAIPCLNLPKALTDLYETLRDKSKNRIAHYYNGSTPDVSAVNAAPGKAYTKVADKCAPVLIQVLTGQEAHQEPSVQKDCDAHNFVEFVYSEPVDIASVSGSTSVAQGAVNVQAAADLGATTNNAAGMTFAGLASSSSGIVNAALKSGSGSPHSLYRNFSDTVGAAPVDHAARVRLSIAGYVDGTISSGGVSYKNWTGYISSAETPAGTIARIANDNIKDKSPAQNSLAVDSPSNHQLPAITVQNSGAANELYGTWDVTPPSFAPLRINGTTNWAVPAYDGSQEFEFVGASYSTGTLASIEMHFFDNQPTYDENYQWFSRAGWGPAGSATEYASISNFAADVRGGSRPDSASNATVGGIRYCSLYNAHDSFKYSVLDSGTYNNFTQDIKGGAGSSLFTYAGTDPGAATHTTGAEDGLYCKLMLDDTSLHPNTTFLMQFDSNTCFITDLAGNRIQCGKITMKSVDRTQPEFLMTAVPLGTKQMLVIFSKALNIDVMTLYDSPSSYTKVQALEWIPKGLELTTASGTGIEIDKNIPATCLFRNNKSTGIVVTLTKDAVLSDVINNVQVTAVGFNKYDPLPGIDATITYIQDPIGNYVIPNKTHAFSDFAVNAVMPQYIYDNTLTDGGVSTDYSLYKEGMWAVRDWNAEQQNYGTLSVGKEYILQTALYDGTSDKSGGLDPATGQLKSGTIKAFFDAAPDAVSVSTKINENTKLSWRIWHPNFTSDIFSSLAPANDVPQFSVDGTANDSGVVFDIPQKISSEKWKNGDQVSFLFKLGDYTVDHFGDGTNYPLYAVRLKDLNDITSLDLWSFKIRTTNLQRGGVSILNNVIDLNDGEHTVIQVDMKESGNLNVMVMTLDGNIVTYLRHGYTDAGTHYYNWNGTNNGGSKVARGLYFVRVIGPGIDETRKVMCVK